MVPNCENYKDRFAKDLDTRLPDPNIDLMFVNCSSTPKTDPPADIREGADL